MKTGDGTPATPPATERTGVWGWVVIFVLVAGVAVPIIAGRDISDVEERRAWVYETLVAEADTSQAGLVAWLDERGIPYTRYYLTNRIEVGGSAIARWQIERRSDVAKVLYNPTLRPLETLPAATPATGGPPSELTWGLESIGVPKVWKEFGARGAGVVVGQSDSGVDPIHPALADGYRGTVMGTDDYNWLDPWFDKPQPYDPTGHGTHTLGTAVGDNLVGVAPDAIWLGCINLARAFGNVANYLDCMQFMLAPHPCGGDPLRDWRPDLAADVSNNSWGCTERIEGCDQETLLVTSKRCGRQGSSSLRRSATRDPRADLREQPRGTTPTRSCRLVRWHPTAPSPSSRVGVPTPGRPTGVEGRTSLPPTSRCSRRGRVAGGRNSRVPRWRLHTSRVSWHSCGRRTRRCEATST